MGQLAVASTIGLVALLSGQSPRLARWRHLDQWLCAIPVILTIWQVLTAKTGILPLPFFPSPQSILEVYTDDASRLVESVVHSMLLLLPGYFIGGALGFGTGVAIGWSRPISYWAHPILRFVGPLPATAWLPVAFFFFPGTFSASTFLIALSTGFPVAVLTASGIGGVKNDYYDIARTLGASRTFLITRVAIPAALPNVFVGLFMGLGASFAVLIVAEMMGVKAGLGWYLQWAQGWAAYANLYGALILMAVLFSGLISLLFIVRDRVLAWQKGIVRW
jgi:NitT/TauT family transport system permease protein